jgi:hypothetical protein
LYDPRAPSVSIKLSKSKKREIHKTKGNATGWSRSKTTLGKNHARHELEEKKRDNEESIGHDDLDQDRIKALFLESVRVSRIDTIFLRLCEALPSQIRSNIYIWKFNVLLGILSVSYRQRLLLPLR